MKQITMLLLLSATLSAGCGSVEDVSHSVSHNCALLGTNNAWDASGLAVHHDDPRSCPFGAQPHQIVEGGGTVHDTRAIYPTGDNTQVWNAILQIFNTPNNCADRGASLGILQRGFLWGDFNGSGTQKWHAPLYLQYEAGTWNSNYDCPVFTVSLLNHQDAVAWTQIKYNLNDY